MGTVETKLAVLSERVERIDERGCKFSAQVFARVADVEREMRREIADSHNKLDKAVEKKFGELCRELNAIQVSGARTEVSEKTNQRWLFLFITVGVSVLLSVLGVVIAFR